MATPEDIANIARNYLRDFGKFFQTQKSVTGRTYDTGHINVSSEGLWVALSTSGASTALTTSQYTLLERDGVVRIDQSVDMTGVDAVLVEGTRYEWLTPGDLDFYTDVAIQMHVHNLNIQLANIAPAVANVIGMNALVQALWGLVTEYARDVDVIASESVHIPASQRYRMAQSLLTYWQDRYDTYAKNLNIGIERIEVFNLRRRSLTTGALVPTYVERELGDRTPPKRIFHEPGAGEIILDDRDDDLREDVYVDGEPPAGYLGQTGYY